MYEDYTEDLEMTKQRIRIKTIDGIDYSVQAQDQSNLWYINGVIPGHLKGGYTNPEKAFRALEVYINQKKQAEIDKDNKRTIWSTDGKGNATRVNFNEHFSKEESLIPEENTMVAVSKPVPKKPAPKKAPKVKVARKGFFICKETGKELPVEENTTNGTKKD